MKKSLLATSLGLVAVLVSLQTVLASDTKPQTVQSVDLNRYVGKWFEIARYPNRFQRKCVGNVSAEYILRPNNRIMVINQCVKKDGKIDDAKGEAKIVDNQSNAKLKVRFAPKFLSFIPLVWGDYWILDLGKNYEYALVGSPDRKYLWVLSRTPKLDAKVFNNLRQIAQREGFNPDKLVLTAQN